MTRLKFININDHYRTDFYFAALFVASLRATWGNVLTLTTEYTYIELLT